MPEHTRRWALLGLGILGLAIANAPAFGQQPEPTAFRPPTDSEVLNAYRVEQVNGYTKITMDHVRPEADGASVLDVTAIRLELSAEAARTGFPKPIIITNYIDQGPEDRDPRSTNLSKLHQRFFEQLTPELLTITKRPLILIEVTAIGKDADGLPVTVHMGSLMADLRKNTLAKNDTHLDLDEENGEFVTPYFQLIFEETVIYDASFRQHERGKPYSEVYAQERHNVGIMIIRASESIN